MKTIKLTQGYVAIVSDKDYTEVSKYKWCAVVHRNNKIYAITSTKVNGIKTGLAMHRFILGLTDSKNVVDHKNNNGLDNRRSNLRVCTHADNAVNRGPNAGLKYKGICFRKKCTKRPYEVSIAFNLKRYFVGNFATLEEAVTAYNEQAKLLHGKFARLNNV